MRHITPPIIIDYYDFLIKIQIITSYTSLHAQRKYTLDCVSVFQNT